MRRTVTRSGGKTIANHEPGPDDSNSKLVQILVERNFEIVILPVHGGLCEEFFSHRSTRIKHGWGQRD